MTIVTIQVISRDESVICRSDALALDYFLHPKEEMVQRINGKTHLPCHIGKSLDGLTTKELEAIKNNALGELQNYVLKLDEDECIVAGGILTSIVAGTKSDDVDYFCKATERERWHLRERLKTEHPYLECQHIRANTYLRMKGVHSIYRLRGQVVIHTKGHNLVRDVNINIIFVLEPVKFVKDTFDFTCTQLYSSEKSSLNATSPSALQDASIWRLHMASKLETAPATLSSRQHILYKNAQSEYAKLDTLNLYKSLDRVLKYVNKGFRVSDELKKRLLKLQQDNPVVGPQVHAALFNI